MLVYLGTLSYDFYLFHAIILGKVIRIVDYYDLQINMFTLSLICILLIVICSYLYQQLSNYLLNRTN